MDLLNGDKPRPVLPEMILNQAEVLAAARGADVLIMTLAAKPVVDPQFRLDRLEVIDVQPGAEPLAAADAGCLAGLRASTAVKIHAKLRRPLKDVKELAEW
jgi:hypothetical protein